MDMNEKGQHTCARKQGATWTAGEKGELFLSPPASNDHWVSWRCSWHKGFAFAYEHALLRNNSGQRSVRIHSLGRCNSGFTVKGQTRNQHQLSVSSQGRRESGPDLLSQSQWNTGPVFRVSSIHTVSWVEFNNWVAFSFTWVKKQNQELLESSKWKQT